MSVEVASPIDWAMVEAALVAWAKTTAPQLTDVIFARQRADQPARPYATLDYVALSQLGDDDLRYTFDAGAVPLEENKVIIAGQRRLLMSVNIYTDAPGLAALTFAERLRTSFALPEALDPLRAVEVAIIDVGDIRDLTELQGVDWLGRAQFDLTLGLAANVEPPSAKGPIINSVEVEGPTNDPVNNATIIVDGPVIP